MDTAVQPPFENGSVKKPSRFSFLKAIEFGVLEIFLVVLTLVVFFGVLNYFNILSLSKLYPKYLGFLPHRPYSQIQTYRPIIPTATPTKLTLSCPVAKEFCKEGKTVTYNGNPALAYNLAAQTEVMSVAPAVDLTNLTAATAGMVHYRTVRQTSIVLKDCYTITYTFPPDASIEKFDLLPLDRGKVLATTSASLLAVGEGKANLIVQLQKRTIDSMLIGKPDFQQCSATNVNPREIGTYQPIDTTMFK